jgi:SWI/SNF-related matrix-associated actin-dependent regulator 1 of chromatin subfamily A
MPALIPEQIEGAAFLAARRNAMLADEPGFGKSAQAVAACDRIEAKNILVVTTASARQNWINEFALWSTEERHAEAWFSTKARHVKPGVTVVAWSNIIYGPVWQSLGQMRYDVLILDESHYAKNVSAKRTRVVYDVLAKLANRVWCLTGTPIPNAPNDIYPMCKALFPDVLEGYSSYHSFLFHYCTVVPRFINGKRVDVVTGGKNQPELAARLKPHTLRRKTTGLPPIRYSVFAMHADKLPDERDVDRQAVIDAALAGSTNELDMHLGTLRRHTGILKAHAAVDLVREELENGLDKIVLFAWHKEVMDILEHGLAEFDCVSVRGGVDAADREGIVQEFQRGRARVFIGQIQAAGEAITLTAACQTLFVEVSFVPKDMAQAVRRILRRGQTRPCLCRVAALAGSIDEALMRIVTRKVETIRTIMDDEEN